MTGRLLRVAQFAEVGALTPFLCCDWKAPLGPHGGKARMVMIEQEGQDEEQEEMELQLSVSRKRAPQGTLCCRVDARKVVPIWQLVVVAMLLRHHV